jgi:hypothetical protein
MSPAFRAVIITVSFVVGTACLYNDLTIPGWILCALGGWHISALVREAE